MTGAGSPEVVAERLPKLIETKPDAGREVLLSHVWALANMLPETAYAKLGWALGRHPHDAAAVRTLMTTPLAGDMTERESHDGYLVFQGGVPEMKEFLGKILS
jgi:glutamyl-tRNA(Gln) amidotransferase subunit D